LQKLSDCLWWRHNTLSRAVLNRHLMVDLFQYLMWVNLNYFSFWLYQCKWETTYDTDGLLGNNGTILQSLIQQENYVIQVLAYTSFLHFTDYTNEIDKNDKNCNRLWKLW